MEHKLKRINRLYPWFAGLSHGLIFYVVINTIWLTNIKGFDAAQITFLEVCAGLVVGMIFKPLLRFAEKIGNTWSIRLGAILLLTASMLFTVGNSYWIFALASAIQSISIIFAATREVLLQNNLSYLHHGQKYINIASRSRLIYTIATMATALASGTLFSIWRDLPMILGNIVCAVCVIMSFFIFDIEEKTQHSHASRIESKHKEFTLPHPIKLSKALFWFCALVYGAILLGQNNSKLLLQYQLEELLTVDIVVEVIGIVWVISRILRIVFDIAYPKIYQAFKHRTAILITVAICTAITLVLIGFFIETDFWIRIAFIGSGFTLFTAIRDPLQIFCQTVLVKRVDKADRKEALVYLTAIERAGYFFFSLAGSLTLAILPLQYIFVMLAITLVPTLIVSGRLSRLIRQAE